MAVTFSATASASDRGSISGDEASPDAVVSWHSDDDRRAGTMTVALPDATFHGKYFQIRLQTEQATLAPIWSGWQLAWSDWPFWSFPTKRRYGVGDFVTRYSGKILANLAAADGTRMRCRIHLASPVREMAEGGEGECQIAGRETVQVQF